jgi:hypothetical protein
VAAAVAAAAVAAVAVAVAVAVAAAVAVAVAAAVAAVAASLALAAARRQWQYQCGWEHGPSYYLSSISAEQTILWPCCWDIWWIGVVLGIEGFGKVLPNSGTLKKHQTYIGRNPFKCNKRFILWENR